MPFEVERTMVPVQPFKLFTYLNSSMLSLGMVKSRTNLVSLEKDVKVLINVPEVDMSLVSRSNTLFLPVVGSILTGSGRINLSY